MAVRIVTDSTADLPASMIRELGITVIPLLVKFGTEAYRDRVDLSTDEFYLKLASSSILPTTSVPPPGEFAAVYQKLISEGDEVLSVHLSNKLSGTYDCALLAAGSLKNAKIEVLNCQTVSMAMGILVIEAAKAAKSGASLKEVASLVRRNMERCYLVGLLDTLECLQKGGRIGRAQALLGHMLNIKPLLTIRSGEVCPLEKVRTRGRALSRMLQFVLVHQPFDEIAVLHSNAPQEAESLAEQLAQSFPRERMNIAHFGPVLGTHIGPGAVGLAFLQHLSEDSNGI